LEGPICITIPNIKIGQTVAKYRILPVLKIAAFHHLHFQKFIFSGWSSRKAAVCHLDCFKWNFSTDDMIQ